MPAISGGKLICVHTKPKNPQNKVMATANCKSEFDFTLVLGGADKLSSDIENALFDAGCDDATLSLRTGRLYLTFSRTANSFKDAIISAIKNVRQCTLDISVVRVDYCDLVTQADIARRIGRTRQLVHQYISGTRGPGRFPAPVCNIADNAPLWYWCEVAYWLWESDIIKESDLREAQDVAVVNSVLELEYHREISPEITGEILNELALQ